MIDTRESSGGAAAHWDAVYATRSPTEVSWFQEEPTVSLELIDAVGLAPAASVLDVGGGTSVLVDRLIGQGFVDVTVLDISQMALDVARARVGDDAGATFLRSDVLSFEPDRTYDLWHDRAALHFLVGEERTVYREVLRRAVAPGGAAVVGTFAPDGPEACSGLPVTRSGTEGILAVLGPEFELIAERRQVHVTPSGAPQVFAWVAARRTR